MKNNVNKGAALALIVGVLFALPIETNASSFYAWKVSNVKWGDTLNVRKYPANYSQKQAAYPKGTVLQMTGRCTKGLDLSDIAHKSKRKQRAAVRYRWCEVWHDPKRNGRYRAGWVYGRFIRPIR